MTNEPMWRERLINNFREKWGRFYYSDLVGMDWEKPTKPNFRPDEEAQIFGSDGKCIASGDVEKDLIETVRQELTSLGQAMVDLFPSVGYEITAVEARNLLTAELSKRGISLTK